MSVLLVTSIFCSWLSGTEPIYGKLIIYSFDFYKMSSAISFPTLATQCTYRELIVIIETNQSHRRIDLLLLNTLFPASFMFCLYCLMFEKSLAHLSTDERFWSMKSLAAPTWYRLWTLPNPLLILLFLLQSEKNYFPFHIRKPWN